MDTKQKRTGKPQIPDDLELPKSIEAERGLCSIVLNHPEASMLKCSETGFQTSDIFDSRCRSIVDTVFALCAQSKPSDIRVVYERLRENGVALEFYELSELYGICSIFSALPEFLDIVKSTAKRRAGVLVLHQAQYDIRTKALNETIADIVGSLEAINHELAPPRVLDTKALLMDATRRYETGDDQSMRIRTGFDELDNMTPIRYSDFVVVGGETKSGKTTLVLNIIANLINETC